MNPVVLYGSEKDGETSCLLLSALHNLGQPVLHLTAQTAALLPPGAKQVSFLLADDCQLRSLLMAGGILLFRENCETLGDIELPRAAAGVLDPENERAAALLRAAHIPAVTCGLSQKNTVTFSSRTPDSTVVSLQKEIRTAAGRPVEPRELPLSLSAPRRDYPLLAAMAVLWLSGIPLPENGLSF